MNRFNPTKALLATLLAGLLVAGTALAQRDKDEPLYPNSTRAEPEAKASQRIGPKLNKMYELYQEEKHDQAIAAAEEILGNSRANDYDKAIAYQTLAYVWLDKDSYPKAIEFLQKALDTNALPNDTHFQMMYQVSQMQMQEEQYDVAMATLDRFMKESGATEGKYLALKGNILYRLERFEESAQVMDQAFATGDKPENSWLQIQMANYFELERPLEAAKIAEQQLAQDPDNVALIRNLSSIYLQAEQNDKAAQVFEDAKAKGLLTDARDYEQLYKLYHYIEREDQAIATINEGLEKGILSPSMELYRTLAEAHYFSERIPQAIEAYGKAAALSENGEIDLSRSRLLQEEQRFAEAKSAAQAALDKGVRRTGDAYLILGAAEFGLGNKAGAVAAYKQAAKYPESKTFAETWLRQSGNL